jgi:hypothetical protein
MFNRYLKIVLGFNLISLFALARGGNPVFPDNLRKSLSAGKTARQMALPNTRSNSGRNFAKRGFCSQPAFQLA